MLSRLLIFVLVLFLNAGCAPEKDDTALQPLADSVASTQSQRLPLSQNQQRLWQQSCALCHVDGNGGAPRVGDIEQWKPRMKQGNAVLLAHTVEGYHYMPPLGYCMACERSDFSALIAFMAGDLK
ncbi:MAG: cytochrome c5 family protein [Gammaproteobacteria bacterium]|nr:cytochrome c5 family protein [Gammaproteobacteria bacterium]MBT5204514.1 cytochrome c5 family protein [Gammaproteobacteria bacterium]MBT5604153.1 cytochrome c5 family protein [Gammaproteobacteria bacterium]MBT6246738.1 cytochrome c5 family protein [Gammaproteobacteria bacterium]